MPALMFPQTHLRPKSETWTRFRQENGRTVVSAEKRNMLGELQTGTVLRLCTRDSLSEWCECCSGGCDACFDGVK